MIQELSLIVEHRTTGGRTGPRADDGQVIEVIEDGIKRKPRTATTFSQVLRWLLNSEFEPTGFDWLTKAGYVRKRKCTYRRKENKDMGKHDDQLLALARHAEKKFPALTTRPLNAAELVRAGKVTQVSCDLFEVQSQTGEDTYAVDLDARSCTCYDYSHNAPMVCDGPMCKHRMAALLWLKVNEPQTAPAAPAAPDPGKIHRQEKRLAALQAGAILI